MSRLPLLYLTAASLCLIGGVVLGIVMGLTHDHSLAPVHAHLNLLGWATLALMGLVLHACPDLGRNRPLAWIQFALASMSCVVVPAGIYLAVMHQQPGVAIAGSLGFLAAVCLFAIRLLLLVFSPSATALRGSWPARNADGTAIAPSR